MKNYSKYNQSSKLAKKSFYIRRKNTTKEFDYFLLLKKIRLISYKSKVGY